MTFGSFVCQNNIKFQQKQPVVVLFQPMYQRKETDLIKSSMLLLFKHHLKFVSSKRNPYKKRERKKILVCACFGFCAKIHAIIGSESQNQGSNVFIKTG